MEQATVHVKPRYYKQLDAMRFFAVWSVMIGHWVSWDSDWFVLKTMHWGNGVIFFFVLSGFLITEILLNQREEIKLKERTLWQSLKTFYIRRSLRIFPLYYLFIFFMFFINYKNTREIFPWLATYTTNILQASDNRFIGEYNHVWTLGIEEQFYLFWPLCIFLVKEKHLFKFIVASIVFSLISRYYYFSSDPGRWMAASYLLHNVMFSLSFGALLAWAKHNKKYWFYKLSNSISATLFMFILYLITFFCLVFPKKLPLFDFVFDDLMFTLLSVTIIARCVSKTGYTFVGKWILENRLLVHLGKISYGLYLYHLIAPSALYEYIIPRINIYNERKETAWVMFFLFTWGLTEVTYWLVEKPVRKLRKYVRY